MKETLEQINKRHTKEIVAFRENCKHEHIHIFKKNGTSGWTRIDNYSNEHFEIGKDRHYDSVMFSCSDCGTPLMAYECGKISLYVRADYYGEHARMINGDI